MPSPHRKIPRSKLHPQPTRLRPPHDTGDDRACTEAGCITLLSGYNPGPRCLLHTADERTEEERMRELDRDLDRDARRQSRLAARN